MDLIRCTNCGQSYPEQGVPYRCSRCGGVYDFSGPFPYSPQHVEPSLPGMWRYRHSFPLDEGAPVVTLGEGRTPLVWGQAFGRQVGFKLEYLNPTGSFKDRGSAVLASFLLSRRVESAVEDSSGNAGASFAAYAARSGLRARIFIPDSAAGPKRAQIEAYGAETVRILGPRSNAAEAVKRAAKDGVVYASHAYLPQVLAGYATIAYELVEQVGREPGAVIVPAGQGNLLLSIGRGFMALQGAGVIKGTPRLIGVQALACAPLWAVWRYGAVGFGWVTEGETLAEGVRVKYPQRGDAVLSAVKSTQGQFVAVEEDAILPGRDQLALQGLYVEPTSAIVWDALAQIGDQLPEPVVAVLTGSGFKYQG